MEKRYGKRMQLHLRAIIKENGQTRTLYYSFPKEEIAFDRPINVFFYVVGWFRAMFTEITEWTILRAIQKTNSVLSEQIMDFFVKKIENGEVEGAVKDANK